MARKLTTKEFIEKAKLVHGNKFDYSLVDYVNSNTKIDIVCSVHGIFKQIPPNHLSGRGCFRCGRKPNSTTSEFIEKAKLVHGNKYDYSLVNYINDQTKINIICHEHGMFLQTPNIHLNKHGCPDCGLNTVIYKNTITLSEFIEKANSVHGDKYDYSLVEYKNMHDKIKIICPIHSNFDQIANDHVNNRCGCPKCGNIIKNLAHLMLHDEFIKKAKLVHGNKYDYSLVEYAKSKRKVKIICSTHGIFKQTPNSHLNGKGCPKCCSGFKSNTEEFIKKAKFIHGDKYDYSLVEYVNSNEKVKIICKKHGIFTQTAGGHTNSKCGCPKCNESKGEKTIEKFLKENNYKFQWQKKFDDCKKVKQLPFDFYLPEMKILIEYDGAQHYKPVDFFGGEKKFKILQINDGIKTEYAKKNNIKLVRIAYNENIIEKLENALSCLV